MNHVFEFSIEGDQITFASDSAMPIALYENLCETVSDYYGCLLDTEEDEL